jgi:hypothetical protein
MAATVRQNSDNSMATEGIASRSAQDADTGGKAVIEAVAAMTQLDTVTQQLARTIAFFKIGDTGGERSGEKSNHPNAAGSDDDFGEF